MKNPRHAAPETLVQIARDANPARLILSHRDQGNLDTSVAEIRQHHAGPITVATDLQYTSVP